MRIEIACGPLTQEQVAAEIPFVCSLFETAEPKLSVMFGVGCGVDADYFSPLEIATVDLPQWIEQSREEEKFYPGQSDLFIYDKRLSARLCHEADIHIKTSSASEIEKCTRRWFGKSYRVLRSDVVPPERASWRQIDTVEQAVAGL